MTVVFFVVARVLTHSRIGTVLKAIRDNDVRAEFMGYNVANYRIFVFCVSAFMAAAAGAMYAAWVGIVSFLDAGPLFSVEGVIWTAVGGRATLIGPFLGAFLVRGREFLLSGSWFANYWQLFMGILFIAVVLVDSRWFGRNDRQLAAQAATGHARADPRGRDHLGARPPARLGAGGRCQAGRGTSLGATQIGERNGSNAGRLRTDDGDFSRSRD